VTLSRRCAKNHDAGRTIGMKASHMSTAARLRICLIAVLAMLTLSAAGATAAAEDPEIAGRRLTERRIFTDAEILDGFYKVAFSAELHRGARADRIRKYDGPVRIRLERRSGPDRRSQATAVIDDIRRRIRHLDIALAEKPGDANMDLVLVRDRDLGRAIRSVYGRDQARRIQKSLEPQCLSGFRRDRQFRIVQSSVIVVADAGDFVFFDCLYEELLQALGPINDDSSVPWSMFNDDVQFGFFDVYDQYLLNVLYHPRIRPGMARADVEAIMPDVLREVRAWVAEVNGLPR
jgi:hypothetical protein